MAEQTRILKRMLDVGLALGAADKYDQLLNRIRLQKFIYLLDVVSYLYGILPPQSGHITYKHGPFDSAIQNAVDCLAFRGLARVFKVERDSDGSIYAEYGLSQAGKLWVDRITKDARFEIKWGAALDIGQKVDTLGWDRLRALVYAEPTFVASKPKGYGQKLIPEDSLKNSAAFFIETMNWTLRQGFENAYPSRDLLLELFFRYLDDYDHLIRSRSKPLNPNGGKG